MTELHIFSATGRMTIPDLSAFNLDWSHVDALSLGIASRMMSPEDLASAKMAPCTAEFRAACSLHTIKLAK